MKIKNIHTRVFKCLPADANYLIDSLANDSSPFWPTKLWPRGKWSQPLQIGSTGSHGGTQYVVETYIPGQCICFRFIYPKNYQGTHSFIIDIMADNSICFKHETDLILKGIDAFLWKIAIRWVHDALIEDALDCAELYLTKAIKQPNQWLKRVYVLRYVLGCSRLLKDAVVDTWIKYKTKFNY